MSMERTPGISRAELMLDPNRPMARPTSSCGMWNRISTSPGSICLGLSYNQGDNHMYNETKWLKVSLSMQAQHSDLWSCCCYGIYITHYAVVAMDTSPLMPLLLWIHHPWCYDMHHPVLLLLCPMPLLLWIHHTSPPQRNKTKTFTALYR